MFIYGRVYVCNYLNYIFSQSVSDSSPITVFFFLFFFLLLLIPLLFGHPDMTALNKVVLKYVFWLLLDLKCLNPTKFCCFVLYLVGVNSILKC